MSVAVIVPWRNADERRLNNWNFVRKMYENLYPDWEIVEAGAPAGPWCKAAAVMPATRMATDADILVIADADVWTPDVELAVGHVERHGTWAMPHKGVWRLTDASTRRVLAGEEFSYEMETVERTYRGKLGGGVVVVHRDVLRRIPMDHRFKGWGGEDEAWGRALIELGGFFRRTSGPLFHMWHPPQDREWRGWMNPTSTKLLKRYERAADNPALMQTIVDEVIHGIR